MPARKKPDEIKFTEPVPIRVTPSMKEDLEKMAQDTSISTSERARKHLEKDIRNWKKGKTNQI